MSTPATSAHTALGPTPSRCMPCPIATRSAAMLSAFATTRTAISAPIATCQTDRSEPRSTRRESCPRRARSDRRSPGRPSSAGRSTAQPTASRSRTDRPPARRSRCPDGSSSDAPVIRPGPSAEGTPATPLPARLVPHRGPILQTMPMRSRRPATARPPRRRQRHPRHRRSSNASSAEPVDASTHPQPFRPPLRSGVPESRGRAYLGGQVVGAAQGAIPRAP